MKTSWKHNSHAYTDVSNETTFQLKHDHSRMCILTYAHKNVLCSCDLDLDRPTLMFELDLDILKMCREVKFVGQGFQKLEPKQDKQT